MNPSFIKLLRSDEVLHLARKHPNAFILLTFIAHRARWENGLPDGLTIGQCHIGDWENMGLTRQEYRTALDILTARNHIEIVETCRNRKKSTTGSTTVGTLVKIISSSTYIIENESPNHQVNHRATTDQPPTNHELERNKSISNDIDKKEYAQTAARPRIKDSLNFDFTILQFVGITESDRQQWQTIYSHIVLDVEIAKATEWVKSNPSKAKKLWRKFLTGWLGRANDTAQNKKAFSYAGNRNTSDRRTKDINGVPVENIHAGRF